MRRWGLVCVVLLAGCKPAPPKAADPVAVAKPAMMPAEGRAAAAHLAAGHPAYKLFRQKIDMPTVLVVEEGTSDDQLRALLWYLRTKIRAGGFKELGMQPTETLYGVTGYNSGTVDIYRGSRCASEKYTPEGKADPCGSSIHKSASYHWGDGNDPEADGAYLVSATGAVTTVFESTDHWQTEAEALADPDGALGRAATARIRYATAETAKQSKRGTDLKFFVATPSTELDAVSYQFGDEAGQKRFVNEYVFLEQERLCAAGFRTVKLAVAGRVGRVYAIDCAAGR